MRHSGKIGKREENMDSKLLRESLMLQQIHVFTDQETKNTDNCLTSDFKDFSLHFIKMYSSPK